MNPISTHPPALTPFDPLSSNMGNLGRATSADIRLKLEERMEISLSTSDGDTVNIRSYHSVEIAAATYSSQGLLNEGGVQIDAGAFYYSEQFEFSITVEGQFTHEEMKDIKKTLDNLGKMMKSATSGHGREALDPTETSLEGRPETVSASLELPKETLGLLSETLAKGMVDIIFDSELEEKRVGEQATQFLDHLIDKFTHENRDGHRAINLAKAVQNELSHRLESSEKAKLRETDHQEIFQQQSV